MTIYAAVRKQDGIPFDFYYKDPQEALDQYHGDLGISEGDEDFTRTVICDVVSDVLIADERYCADILIDAGLMEPEVFYEDDDFMLLMWITNEPSETMEFLVKKLQEEQGYQYINLLTFCSQSCNGSQVESFWKISEGGFSE